MPVGGLLMLGGCAAAIAGLSHAGDEPAATGVVAAPAAATAEPADLPEPSAPTSDPAPSPSVDRAALVQAAVEETGGWAHWSDTVVDVDDTGMFVNVATTLYDKPSNEEPATRLCAFTLASSMSSVEGDLNVRVLASNDVRLAMCEVPA